MVENISLPHDLEMAIGSESRDFAVKADRVQPSKQSFFLIVMGIVWLAFEKRRLFLQDADKVGELPKRKNEVHRLRAIFVRYRSRW